MKQYQNLGACWQTFQEHGATVARQCNTASLLTSAVLAFRTVLAAPERSAPPGTPDVAAGCPRSARNG